MRVTLIPNNGDEPKVFDVVSIDFNTGNGELTLKCRDGRVCLGLVGQWQMSVKSSQLVAMSCENVERIHDGRSLLLV